MGQAEEGLAGKVVVITGAARGIGALLAEAVASRGGRPALLGLEPSALAEVAERLGAPWWHVDVTDARRLGEVAEDVVCTLGRVDAVVANAGVASGGTLRVGDPGAYERTVEVNLLGSIRTARAFLPALLASKGYFLQMASVAAAVPLPAMGAYCAAKSGVEAFTHCLAGELAAHGASAGIAYLTWTDTDMVRGAAGLRGAGGLGLLGKVHPLEPAVERIADGLARRSLHIYGQGFVRGLLPWRGIVPWLMLRAGRRPLGRQVRLFEGRIRALGPEASGLVGPGGVAAAQVVAQ